MSQTEHSDPRCPCAALRDAARAVVDAFVELGKQPGANIATRTRRHRKCEAALLALDDALGSGPCAWVPVAERMPPNAELTGPLVGHRSKE